MKTLTRIFKKDSWWGIGSFLNLVLAAMLILPFTSTAAPEDKITICHATSSETNPFETLHVSANATAGHFENNGTTKAGHEGDFIIQEENAECPGAEVDGTGTLTVQKVVSGGTAVPEDFSLHVKGSGDIEVDNSPQAGSSSGTEYTLDVGSYTVSESGGPAGYTASFSSDCSGGTVDLVADADLTCTVTNTFQDDTGGPEDVSVTIIKYLDGQVATVLSADNAEFPMTASWDADNIGAGSGDFTLGPTGFNNATAYHATTSEMSTGADYTASEVTSNIDAGSPVLPASAACEDGKFRLVGYSSGDTLTEAEDASTSTTAPAFTGLVNDKTIIVHNETCGEDGGSGGDEEPITNFHFIKQICPSYSDIAGNTDAQNHDATGGHFNEFSNFSETEPHFPPRPDAPVTPAEIPANCDGAAGWNFQVDNNREMSSPTLVGPTNGEGEISVPFADLPSDVKTTLLSGGIMWVSEVTQQTAAFGALRCYFDALNGDNLEFLQFGTDPVNNYPPNAYCIAYNVSGDVLGDTTGTIHIQKFVCDEGTQLTAAMTPDAQGNATIPESCEQAGSGWQIGAVFEEGNTTTNPPFPSHDSFTLLGTTNSEGELSITVPAGGRHFLAEGDGEGNFPETMEGLIGFACEDDAGTHANNFEAVFVETDMIEHCNVFNVGEATGPLVITKYVCADGLDFDNSEDSPAKPNAAGEATIPAGCELANGFGFGYIHEPSKSDISPPYPGLEDSTVFTPISGVTGDDGLGKLIVNNLPIGGRLDVAELDSSGNRIADAQVYGFMCNEDSGIKNNNYEVVFNAEDKTTFCNMYNTAGVGGVEDTSLRFIKVVCPDWSDVAGNADADQFDATGGQFENFSNFDSQADPNFPDPYPFEPVSSAEIPGNCVQASGWQFLLSSDQDQENNTHTVTTGVNGEVMIAVNDLPAGLATHVSGGGELWISEVMQQQDGPVFATIRCATDATFGDNLEMVQLSESTPANIFCIAYNVGDVGGGEQPCDDATIMTLLSGTDTQFVGSTTTLPSDLSDETLFTEGTAGAAVAASPTGFPGAWDAAASDPDVSGAIWVNSSATMPTNPAGPGGDGSIDSWQLFSHTFTIPDGAVGISSPVLHFTGDNSVTAFLDNVLITTASDTTVVTDSSALTLTPGTHTLEFAVKNDAFQGENNPTGLIYSLQVSFCAPEQSSGGGGGGGSSRSSSNDDDDDNDGLVLGDTTSIPFPSGVFMPADAGQVLGDTAPEVLGATVGDGLLPRTGTALASLSILLIPLAVLLILRRQHKQSRS